MGSRPHQMPKQRVLPGLRDVPVGERHAAAGTEAAQARGHGGALAGREVFDDQTLASAVAAMNRYTRRPIVIADESLASLRISGVYGTKDPEAFARSVTILMPARVEFSPTQILLRAAEEN